jgi:uncharacterized membrane protein YphA (DoxX/SURF4 family)
MSEKNNGGLAEQVLARKPMPAVLLCLRLVIGWQLLYEGLAKLLTPDWTAAPYLLLSRGFFPGFFHWLGSSAGLLGAVNFLNTWGLTLIGLALILGVVTRFASACGIVLLALYYLAQPPLIRTNYWAPVEGHYMVVNKNLVELLVLVVFLFVPAGALWGLDRFWRGWRSRKKATAPDASPATGAVSLTRRKTLENLLVVPVLGLLGYAANKKYHWEKVHAITGATIKLQDLSLKDLKGELPQGTLGKLKISRLIMGHDLIAAIAHTRDLVYGSQLFKAYNTDRKVFETLELAERAGINTMFANPVAMRMIKKYQDLTGSKIQTISLAYFHKPEELKTNIDRTIDSGVSTIYLFGGDADRYVKDGRVDVLGKGLDYIKSQGYMAGICAHSIEVPIQCEKAGLNPDYYVKTLHSDNYWSATPLKDRVEYAVVNESLAHGQMHDNMWDLFPDKTIAFMETVKKPWIAFKVLAAGAFHPREGFRFAFENGGDFICVGMFDFQVVENVNVTIDVLSSLKNRKRPWYA